MNEPIHIVCLDAPAPPDYGGAIDMYYTIVALAKTGRKPILHYFEYGEKRNTKELEPFCSAIYAYPRKSLLKSFSLSKPYIITSRINHNLISRLNQDQHPILLEGLHCTGILPELKNPQRVVVRMHNEEASYYQKLAENEKSFLKRIYYNMESSLLSGYYSKIPPGNHNGLPGQNGYSPAERTLSFFIAPFYSMFYSLAGDQVPGRKRVILFIPRKPGRSRK